MKLLSMTQAAEKLQCSRQWVWILILRERIKAWKVGNQYVIPAEQIKYLTNDEQNP